MEEMLLKKRRAQLEEEVQKDKYNYDLWFDYVRLEEQAPQPDFERLRTIYERAIECKPLIEEKIHWRRYIYLWLNYTTFEET